MILSVRAGRRVEWAILCAITILVLSVTLAPIIMVIVISFTSGETLAFPPPNWSLRWYRSALAMVRGGSDVYGFVDSIWTTFRITITVTILCALLGVPAAYALVRFSFPGKAIIEELVTLPLVFPLIVLGIALLLIASQLGFESGFWRIVVGHVIITFPFMVRNCTASLQGLNPTLEEAARTLGATPVQMFFEIILPQMRSGIFAGAILVFIISFNEFTVAYFLYTVEAYPLSIWLFARGTNALDPTIFALSTIIIVFDLGLLWLLDRVVGEKSITV
jgi:putative spermidine/putrescine transport system permease protein